MNRAPPPRPRSTPTGRTPRNRPATHRRGQKRIQPQSPPPRPARQQTYPPRRGSRRVPFPPRRPLGPLPARRRQRRKPGPAHRRRPVPPRPCLLHGGRHLPRPLPLRGRQGRAPPRLVRHQDRLRRTGRQAGAASTHPARRARPPGPRFQRRLRGSQLLHQTRPIRNQHRALHRPLPPPVENVSGTPRRLPPQVGQALPPAETDPPEVGQAAPPAAAATPSKSTNYHSNPKNGGIAKFSAGGMLLLLHALLHAVPELIAALAGLANLTGPHHPEPSTQNPAPSNGAPIAPRRSACHPRLLTERNTQHPAPRTQHRRAKRALIS